MTPPLNPDLVIARRRLRLLGGLFAVALAALGLRVVDLTLSVDEMIGAHAMTSAAPRGRADIVDRNGVLLATDYPKLSLYADPLSISDPATVAAELARVLAGLDAARLQARIEQGGRFVWVKRHISERERDAVMRLGLPGVGVRTEMHRVYPQRALTSHLIGFVGVENQGLAGIERSFEPRLINPETAGRPLALTLDLRVQEVVRSELLGAVQRFRAEGGSALVLDAASGEVLAMASLPDFDPNHYRSAEPLARFNRNTQGAYELGSLFKVFTAAMALDSGVVAVDDAVDAIEPLAVGRHRIRDFHAHKRRLSVAEVVAFSSNIGAAKMAQALGSDVQRAYFDRLGLTTRHPIRLPEVGTPQLPDPWRPINTVTAAYGHGIAVSPLQVADGLAAALCGTASRRPAHLVAEDAPPSVPPALVDPGSSAKLRWLMWLTVSEGTGNLAAVPGYLVGGKTGSADRAGPGGYGSGGILASFVAAFPIDQPRYVVLVILDRPQGDASTYHQAHGGWTAAPTAGRIISRIGPMLGLAPVEAHREAWFRERLIEGEAFNGRLERSEKSLAARRDLPWSWDWQGRGACGCGPCSILG
jgi:cell division protein FtsI (penicillin-binding protein 3)